ncbi:MAG: GNAT family N-acetyltransferase [Mycoplasma sp.]|nr:GNAT family N-acetyltransferase [Mycoplasma sp.]
MLVISKNQNFLKQISVIEKNLFVNNSFTFEDIKKKSENNVFNFCFEINQKNILLGYAIFINHLDFIEVEKMGVIKESQRKGIGSKILNKIKTFDKRIILEVSNRDKTIEFYLKNNFKIINNRKKYYWDNSDAIVLEFNPNI